MTPMETITVRHLDGAKHFDFVQMVTTLTGGHVHRSGHQSHPGLGVNGFTVVSVPCSSEREFCQTLVQFMPTGTIYFH